MYLTPHFSCMNTDTVSVSSLDQVEILWWKKHEHNLSSIMQPIFFASAKLDELKELHSYASLEVEIWIEILHYNHLWRCVKLSQTCTKEWSTATHSQLNTFTQYFSLQITFSSAWATPPPPPCTHSWRQPLHPRSLWHTVLPTARTQEVKRDPWKIYQPSEVVSVRRWVQAGGCRRKKGGREFQGEILECLTCNFVFREEIQSSTAQQCSSLRSIHWSLRHTTDPTDCILIEFDGWWKVTLAGS